MANGIPNELLKLIAIDIKEDLAQAISRLPNSDSKSSHCGPEKR